MHTLLIKNDNNKNNNKNNIIRVTITTIIRIIIIAIIAIITIIKLPSNNVFASDVETSDWDYWRKCVQPSGRGAAFTTKKEVVKDIKEQKNN